VGAITRRRRSRRDHPSPLRREVPCLVERNGKGLVCVCVHAVENVCVCVCGTPIRSLVLAPDSPSPRNSGNLTSISNQLDRERFLRRVQQFNDRRAQLHSPCSLGRIIPEHHGKTDLSGCQCIKIECPVHNLNPMTPTYTIAMHSHVD
jgi:hypothetical protein